MDKFLDTYIIGSAVMLGFAYFYFRLSMTTRSRGQVLFGVASLLLSVGFFLGKFSIYLLTVFAVIAFVLTTIGNGIFLTTEQEVWPRFRRKFWEVVFRRERPAIEETEKSGKRGRLFDQAIPMGYLLLLMGAFILLWRKEKVYPLLVIGTGVFFIITGLYCRRKT